MSPSIGKPSWFEAKGHLPVKVKWTLVGMVPSAAPSTSLRAWLGACLLLLAACSGSVQVQMGMEDFSDWRDETGAWQAVGWATVSPDNDELLVTEPGQGVLVNGPEGSTVDLFSQGEFGDVQVHVEFMVPRNSNSGVYFMGRYEIQIFDSWGAEEPQFSDCGGVYQRWDESRDPKGYEGRPPRVNPARPPGEWQTFEVIFRAPRFDDEGNKVANARFEEVVHNGMVVHENVEVTGPTRAAAYQDEMLRGPLMVQGDHGPVAFRNIWIVPLD